MFDGAASLTTPKYRCTQCFNNATDEKKILRFTKSVEHPDHYEVKCDKCDVSTKANYLKKSDVAGKDECAPCNKDWSMCAQCEWP
jgi:hypothetical protein